MFDFSFTDFQDFLIMDGHGIYVWTVYLVTSALIVVSFLIVRHKLNVLKRKLENASA
jgi:heme exporter protein D